MEEEGDLWRWKWVGTLSLANLALVWYTVKSPNNGHFAYLKDFSFGWGGGKSNSSSLSSSLCGYWANQRNISLQPWQFIASALLLYDSANYSLLVSGTINFPSVISGTAETTHAACFVHIGDLFSWLCCGMGLTENITWYWASHTHCLLFRITFLQS